MLLLLLLFTTHHHTDFWRPAFLRKKWLRLFVKSASWNTNVWYHSNRCRWITCTNPWRKWHMDWRSSLCSKSPTIRRSWRRSARNWQWLRRVGKTTTSMRFLREDRKEKAMDYHDFGLKNNSVYIYMLKWNMNSRRANRNTYHEEGEKSRDEEFQMGKMRTFWSVSKRLSNQNRRDRNELTLYKWLDELPTISFTHATDMFLRSKRVWWPGPSLNNAHALELKQTLAEHHATYISIATASLHWQVVRTHKGLVNEFRALWSAVK